MLITICDMDHFNSINDRYSHPVGNRVLKTVASALAQGLEDRGAIERPRQEGSEAVKGREGVPLRYNVGARERRPELIDAEPLRLSEAPAYPGYRGGERANALSSFLKKLMATDHASNLARAAVSSGDFVIRSSQCDGTARSWRRAQGRNGYARPRACAITGSRSGFSDEPGIATDDAPAVVFSTRRARVGGEDTRPAGERGDRFDGRGGRAISPDRLRFSGGDYLAGIVAP